MAMLLIWTLMLSEPFVPATGTVTFPNPDVVTLSVLVRGRLLVFGVKKGMTKEQVSRILGQPTIGYGHGPYDNWLGFYPDGVIVSYGGGKAIAATVNKIVIRR